MDNYSIKSVAFGGFDKQDVVRYIEQSSQQAAATQQALQEELDTLHSQKEALENELSTLKTQFAEVSARCDKLSTQLTQEISVRQTLEPLKPLQAEVEQLKAENEALRPDAEAYAQFRDRIGSIECEARKRAADLEAATMAQLRETVDLFRQQYQILMSTFETTASHVTGELRKVEVNLTQLPRAMDQAGSELNILAAQLKQEEK